MQSALILAFNGIIAVATVVYVVFTRRLWKATSQSAQAAKDSADAAKESADISRALHRPYLGVLSFRRENDHNSGKWLIACEVKNHGTLPASNVRTDIDIDRRGQGQYGAGTLYDGCEIFPQSELSGFLEIHVDAETKVHLASGGWPMVAHVRIRYVDPGGTSYVHSAEFAYDREAQNFRPEGSGTKAERR